ncbi:MAG: hypothetical protein ACOZBW_04750, partial [Thermodesulfobacteriota bacterium]
KMAINNHTALLSLRYAIDFYVSQLLLFNLTLGLALTGDGLFFPGADFDTGTDPDTDTDFHGVSHTVS